MEYLHSQKPYPVIHRDLKCDNIFVSSSTGDIRIGDLGLSTFMKTSHNKTVLGTPQYMAPELFEERYGPTVDIYSFGLCLLEMCTHSIPYAECKTPVEVYRKVTNGIRPLVLERILAKDLKEFIELCLAPVDQRPHAEELLTHPFLNIDENDEKVHQPILLKPEEPSIRKSVETESAPQTMPQTDKTNEELKNRNAEREETKSIHQKEGIFSRTGSRDERKVHATNGNGSQNDLINMAKVESSHTREAQDSEIKLWINIGSKDSVTGMINRTRLDFVFNLRNDTPDGVAEEIANIFNLRPSFIPKIAQVIKEKIEHCHEESTANTPISSGMPSRNSSFENIIRDFKSYGVPSPFSSGNTSPIETQTKERQHKEYMRKLMDEMSEQKLIQIPPFKSSISRSKQDNDPEDVKLVQLALCTILNTKNKADGIFGKKTEALVKRFQEEAGMLVNGVVNKAVWDQLMMNYERKKRWEKDQVKESNERRKTVPQLLRNSTSVNDREMIRNGEQ